MTKNQNDKVKFKILLSRRRERMPEGQVRLGMVDFLSLLSRKRERMPEGQVRVNT
jgi:hypothetical protein